MRVLIFFLGIILPYVAWGQGSKSKATYHDRNFNRPLYFDIFGDEGALPPLEFEYDLTRNGGRSLIVGNVLLNDSTFYFGLATLERLLGPHGSLAGEDAKKLVLAIRWPEALLNSGQIEMITRSGSVIWKYEVKESDVEAWKTKLKTWQQKMNLNPRSRKKPSILSTQVGIMDVIEKAGAPFQQVDDWFRFCISKTKDLQVTRLCSGRYMVRQAKGQLQMAKQVINDNAVRVLVKNEEGQLKNRVSVAPEMPFQFYADLATGISYEFVSVPPKIHIADMSETKKPGLYRVIGWDVFPFAPYRNIKREQYGKLTSAIGFESTIKDQRKFWLSVLRDKKPYYYFPGEGGGIFKQSFDLSLVPKANARVYLHKNAPKGTYADTIYLIGKKHPDVKVSSEEWSAENDTESSTDFSWDFKAAEPGIINRSYLSINYEDRTHKSYFEIYRSYSHELSGRFTGVYSSIGNSLIALGEVAYNYWVETIFGWSNYYISRQRWGFNGKYFKTLTPLTYDAAGNTGFIETTVVDLKYRLTPGLWTRDETLGLMGSYQDFKFGPLKTPMLGVGAFWARSMPAVFDRLFNYLPFMDYPKWVDMEFIYYTTPLNPDVTLSSSYSLNFHGQVLWKKNFFGEAGFGMKTYGLADHSTGKFAELSTFYGTVGLGIKF